LQHYLRQGGTIVSLASGPFPFYYNERGRHVEAAQRIGFSICGSGEGERVAGLAAERLGGWEEPPPGVRLTFYKTDPEGILPSVPQSFAWPEEVDQRWRPIISVPPERGEYTPLLSLKDEAGNWYGDGAAIIRYGSGDIAGGRVVYVWASLTRGKELQAKIVPDLLEYLLRNTAPPPPSAAGGDISGGALSAQRWQAKEGRREAPTLFLREHWARQASASLRMGC